MIVASAVTAAMTLWLLLDRNPPMILGGLGFPGLVAAIFYHGFDHDPDKSTVVAEALFLSVNFVWYFALARAFIGAFKIVKDIREA